MNKKEYISPSCTTITLAIQSPLLTVSVEGSERSLYIDSSQAAEEDDEARVKGGNYVDWSYDW